MAYLVDSKQFTGQAAVEVRCWCGVQFAVPESLHGYYKRANESNHGAFGLHCPLGHEMYPAGRSEADRLREQLEYANSRAARANVELAKREREIIARKGHATRLKKRIAAGVCPCCQRTFRDLARHMSGQHPDYAEPEA